VSSRLSVNVCRFFDLRCKIRDGKNAMPQKTAKATIAEIGTTRLKYPNKAKTIGKKTRLSPKQRTKNSTSLICFQRPRNRTHTSPGVKNVTSKAIESVADVS